MSDMSVYGFENWDGEPDEFRTLDLQEAIEYARKNHLKMVEHIFEWTEQVPVREHDYRRQGPPPSTLLRGIPPEGSRIRLGYIERFPHFNLEAGEIAVVIGRDFKQGIVWVKLETHHECLDEWDNELSFSIDLIGGDWPTVTDDGDKLRIVFWEEVDEVLSEAEQTA